MFFQVEIQSYIISSEYDSMHVSNDLLSLCDIYKNYPTIKHQFFCKKRRKFLQCHNLFREFSTWRSIMGYINKRPCRRLYAIRPPTIFHEADESKEKGSFSCGAESITRIFLWQPVDRFCVHHRRYLFPTIEFNWLDRCPSADSRSPRGACEIGFRLGWNDDRPPLTSVFSSISITLGRIWPASQPVRPFSLLIYGPLVFSFWLALN